MPPAHDEGAPGKIHLLFYLGDVIGLRSFLALNDFKLDRVTFLKRLKPVTLDS